MPMSLREKSQWAVLAVVLLVYAPYFANALPGHTRDVGPQDVARFVGAVVALVVLQAVGHALLALANRREAAHGVPHDERDRLVDLRASRVALHVLAVGVFASLVTALTVPGNFAFVHVLFGAWVASHVVQLATSIAMYRRGG